MCGICRRSGDRGLTAPAALGRTSDLLDAHFQCAEGGRLRTVLRGEYRMSHDRTSRPATFERAGGMTTHRRVIWASSCGMTRRAGSWRRWRTLRRRGSGASSGVRRSRWSTPAPRGMTSRRRRDGLIVASETRGGSRVVAAAWSRREHRCSRAARAGDFAILADGFGKQAHRARLEIRRIR